MNSKYNFVASYSNDLELEFLLVLVNSRLK